ncbi:hypothetical protein IU501_07285 [Nocardia otitidiscaviarum]|nr:hypothetical protein [Nocardia otitidiscaviarum]MBF6132805.1 hypothetical protein [Nocardia otitidiscaviarum]
MWSKSVSPAVPVNAGKFVNPPQDVRSVVRDRIEWLHGSEQGEGLV